MSRAANNLALLYCCSIIFNQRHLERQGPGYAFQNVLECVLVFFFFFFILAAKALFCHSSH